ncbi:hypothetical protein TIFTF001_055138 [Ficus carica]|uniref:Disease resistance protein At4g27190-like leucine-rich repeats domain-containing protein n=1 Tax=Ficus carica TaxID=3494 RepID=A0AA88JGD8_FICCA|nr:hypothetical protein TIFTF001_055138 [Ficus carica]
MPTSPPTRSIERPTLFSDKVAFNNLQELTIERCNSLRSVWAKVETLQQLKELSIRHCDLIEEVLVITKEAGDHEETKSKKITFPKLESLSFYELPKLKRTFIAKSIPSTSTTVEEVEERRMAQEILFSQKVQLNVINLL